ncbi:MAG TPA: histidine kinase [Steroidobacteraceae bacterium]|nr:histidine kinase [Steroidobacteraceae bacterium]
MTSAQTGARSTGWRWIAAIWSAGALFDATQTVFTMRAEGGHQSWSCPLLFLTEFASWLPWALATPLVIRVVRRHPLARDISVRAVCIHLGAFAAISAVAATWCATLQTLFNPYGHSQQPTFMDTWSTTLLYQALTYLIAYALIVSVTLVVNARESMARQLTETARLNEELSKAQLAALRRQIEPHFMYNTLNSIAALVRDHLNDAAVSMIVGLSEFLRRSSEDSHRSQVALQEEVEYLQRYLDIQKVRFGERLQVSMDIPAELLRAQVPNLLLQPLVENAIKHGIAKRVAGGAVRVAGARQKSSLCLSVYNDGPTLPADWEATKTGVGIRNLRTRLQILHGSESELQLRRANPGGVEVLVTLPFREG